MNAKKLIPVVGGLFVVGVFTCAGFAQQGVGEKVGETLDNVGRGIKHEAQVVGEGVRKRFDAVRGDVQGMGVHSRVYSRLHWDTMLYNSKVEVHMVRNGVVLLRGTVADTAAKERALLLTRETVGVTEVFDEIVAITTTPPSAPTPEPRASR